MSAAVGSYAPQAGGLVENTEFWHKMQSGRAQIPARPYGHSSLILAVQCIGTGLINLPRDSS